MEDQLIKAQLCCQEAENAMVASNFLVVAEKFQEASQIYTQIALIASSTANRLQLESFAQVYSRKAQEAEAYINQSGNANLFDYGSLGTSEDSDSEETSSSGHLTDRDSPMVARRATPSLDVVPARARTGSWSKPASLEEQAYAVQLEKRISTSPLQALAMGFQTVKDLVLGARPTGALSLGNISPTSPSSATPKPTSLGESFFLIADSTAEGTEREQKLEQELARVQGEFQKVQAILDQIMEQQTKMSRLGTPSSMRHGGSSSIQSTALAREAHLKQSLRENYLAGSDVHLSKSELESEIKKLREQVSNAERRNAEWAVKFDQIKQKALRRPRSDSSNQSTSPSSIVSASAATPTSQSSSSSRPATTASSFHSPSRNSSQLQASEFAAVSLASSSPHAQ